MRHALIALAILAGLNVALALVPVPLAIVRFVGLIIGIVFIATPIYAIYRAADHAWTPKLALGCVGLGIAAHLGFALLAKSLMGPIASLSGAFAQVGLMIWCVGLGAWIATALIKETNLLVPVSIFLIAFDIFLVLTPIGPVQKILQSAPQVFTTVAYKIPKVSTTATLGPVGAAAYIGPADFLFMAMFFVSIYRFGMRAKTTAIALSITLALYMLAVMALGPLPALPPIGLCVLLVNREYFKLKKDEVVATVVVTLLLAGLLTFAATRPKPPVAPSQPAPAPKPQGSASSPAPRR